MRISRFDSVTRAEEGVKFSLIDPVTKDESGAFLVLCGADSSAHKEVRKEQDAKNKALGRALGNDEAADQAAEVLARCTKGWEGLLDDNDKDIPFTQAKAKALYLAYPELSDRVATFIYSRNNFFTSASAS